MHPTLEPRQPLFLPTLLGPLILVTPPAGLVTTLPRAKAHLKVEVADDDDLINEQLAAATTFCEQEIDGHRQFLPATFDVPVRCWWETLKLPRPPLASVGSVKYWDSGGAQQTLDAATYQVWLPWRQPGWIERAPGKSWPALQADRPWPITIRFTAGYANADAVPRTVKQAILMVLGHWYVNREAWVTGTIATELGLAVTSLLQCEGYGFYG